MRMTFSSLAAAIALALTTPGWAALEVGTPAPAIDLPAALAGQDSHFVLSEALKQGPVVVYFYPKAFTSGCTVEAHLFAEAMDDFKALGASVIGISNDDIPTLHKFSLSECGGKFPVAADEKSQVIAAYDAKMPVVGNAKRVSYVVAPSGEIIYSYSAMSPQEHVKNTMQAVRGWRNQASTEKP